MKKLLISMLTLTMCICATAGVITATAESKATGEFKEKDVTDGLPEANFSVTDYSGNSLTVGCGGPESADVSYTLAALNDGIENSWSSIAPLDSQGNKTLGWFTVDLGKVYPVKGISVTMMHDWGAQDCILQVSETDDFANAVTIYSNDFDNSMNLGKTTTADESVPVASVISNWGNYGDSAEKGGNIWRFSPVAARYVRLTNAQYGDGYLHDYSACGEINVYSYDYSEAPVKTDEVAPVMTNLVSGHYTDAKTLTVKSVYDNAEIYYTTDGSVPTQNSLRYTAPIILQTDKNYNLRFINVVNGVASLPVDYKFNLDVSGTNLALGKRAALTSIDGSEELFAINMTQPAAADDIMKLTDGSFSVDGCVRLGSYDGSTYSPRFGWATIDLGRNYSIDKIVLSTWQGWTTTRTVIQVAKSADFSDAVLIYSNDDANEVINRVYTIDSSVSTHWALSNHGAVGNTNDLNGNIWNFPVAVECRYVRVTNRTNDPSSTYLTELQVFAAAAETQPDPSEESKNVAFGKQASFTSIDGSETLIAIDAGLNEADNKMLLTDGSFSVDGCVRIGSFDGSTYTPRVGWATLDLGRVYSVDKIIMSMWQKWGFKQVVIQVAKSADFSDAVLIYSNDDNHMVISDNPYSIDSSVSTHWNLGNDGAVGDTNDLNGNIWNITEPVECRYVRVTNNTSDPAATYLTELQVFGKPIGIETEEYEYVNYVKAVEAEKSLMLKVGYEKSEIDALLGECIMITLSDGTERQAKGTWTIENYDKDVAATYNAVFVPEETGDAYGLLDGITVELKVVKYFITAEVENKTYDGEPAEVSVTSDETGYTVSYYKDETKLDGAPVNAGTYKVKVEIGSDADYVCIEKTFTINKAEIESFTAEAEDKVYDGVTVEITVSTEKQYVIKYYKGETLLESAPVNAGSYRAVVEVAESENYLGASVECTFIISKAAAAPVTLTVEDKVYDGNPISVQVSAGGDYTLTYYINDVAVEGAAVNAGYYKVVVTVAETENNFGTSGFEYFTISKAELTFTVKAEGKVYDGQPATVAVQGAENYTLTWRKDGQVIDGAPVNAGSYTVTVTVAESANYESAIKDETLVISKAAFDAKVKYNGKTLTVNSEAPTAADFTYEGEGTLTVNVPELTKGIITVSYTFTPDNGNYEVSTGTVEIEVVEKVGNSCSGKAEIGGSIFGLISLAAVYFIIKKAKKRS